MKALSLQQPPPHLLHPKAYLAGVVLGDGWLSGATTKNRILGLRVADADFAAAFAEAVSAAFGRRAKPRRDERGYWVVRTSNRDGVLDELRTVEPVLVEQGTWLRGLFDSEGNAQLTRLRSGPNCFGRRVAFYSTNLETLDRAAYYLTALGMLSGLSEVRPTRGHLGTKPVFQLRLLASREAFDVFRTLVGSSIGRKRAALDAIVASYEADLPAARRRAQLLGAEAKHRKLMKDTLPAVVNGVADLIRRGVKPTQRNCRVVPGFNSVQRHVSQSSLVDLAKEAL